MSITIGLPGASATTFASSPIPSLEILKFPSGEILANRFSIGTVTAPRRSNYGTPALNAPAYTTKYGWQINCILTEAEWLRLSALIEYSTAEYKAGNDGKLRLVDETQFLPPEDSPHTKNLLSDITWPDNAGYVYGYGAFDVIPTEPPTANYFGHPQEKLWQVSSAFEEI